MKTKIIEANAIAEMKHDQSSSDIVLCMIEIKNKGTEPWTIYKNITEKNFIKRQKN